jgi:E3 ubiquitin-protein ligase HUWE1
MVTKDADSGNIQVARIMLEKNYVSLLTAAAGEVDLNYPGVKLVLGSLLKALEQL